MSKRLTQEEVNTKLKENFIQNVELIGEYKNNKTKILLKCKDCGHKWEALPTSVLYADYKHKCPNCGFKKGQYVKCAYCGKEIYRTNHQLEKNKTGFYYCSRECGNRHKNQLRRESGEWDNSANYRLKAFKNYEHKCSICGWNEDERVLEVHHIDENRENNELNNLIILCPICHRKITLHLYKIINKNQLIKIK